MLIAEISIKVKDLLLFSHSQYLPRPTSKFQLNCKIQLSLKYILKIDVHQQLLHVNLVYCFKM